MKKVILILLIILFSSFIWQGCHTNLPSSSPEQTEEEELMQDQENGPGPAPNSGDGTSDGPGWS